MYMYNIDYITHPQVFQVGSSAGNASMSSLRGGLRPEKYQLSSRIRASLFLFLSRFSYL